MEIKPTYVTFEQAKLLKEKGYCNGSIKSYFVETGRYSNFTNSCNNKIEEDRIEAPEQWQVVEWLLQKYRLDVIIRYPESKTNKVSGINSVYYDLEIYRLQDGDAHKLFKFIQISNNKQKAYSAAIDHILKEQL